MHTDGLLDQIGPIYSFAELAWWENPYFVSVAIFLVFLVCVLFYCVVRYRLLAWHDLCVWSIQDYMSALFVQIEGEIIDIAGLYSSVCACTKYYGVLRHNIPAAALTDKEFIALLKKQGNNQLAAVLDSFYERANHVKFAQALVDSECVVKDIYAVRQALISQ